MLAIHNLLLVKSSSAALWSSIKSCLLFSQTVALLALSLAAVDAAEIIVWQDEAAQAIRRASIDGSHVVDVYHTQHGGTGLTVDFANGYVYWTTTVGAKSIQRVKLNGTGFETLVTAGLVVPEGITLDLPNGKMYWADQGPAKISRANLDGTDVEVLVTSGTVHPHDIGIVDGKMYWTDSRTNDILRANVDGSSLELLTNLNPTLGTPSPRGLAVDSNHVYWSAQGYGTIQRSNLDGSGIESIVSVPGWNGPDGIALYGGKMYWAGTNEILKIQRSNLDGSDVEDLITTGLQIPRGIDVGSIDPGLLLVPFLRLDFNAPVAGGGGVNDVNGLGTGFTNWLPGTGGSIPRDDPNLNLLTVPGYLVSKSQQAHLNHSSSFNRNIDILDAPGVLLTDMVGRDFRVTIKADDVYVPDASDQLILYAGTDADNSLRGGFHQGNSASVGTYSLAGNVGAGDFGFPSITGLGEFAAGDDVILSLSRNSGLWELAWENLTNPAASGSFGGISAPWLDAASDLYVGIMHQNAHNFTPQTAKIDYFQVELGAPIPEPSSLALIALAGVSLRPKKRLGLVTRAGFQSPSLK